MEGPDEAGQTGNETALLRDGGRAPGGYPVVLLRTLSGQSLSRFRRSQVGGRNRQNPLPVVAAGVIVNSWSTSHEDDFFPMYLLTPENRVQPAEPSGEDRSGLRVLHLLKDGEDAGMNILSSSASISVGNYPHIPLWRTTKVWTARGKAWRIP